MAVPWVNLFSCGATGPEELKPSADGSEQQQALAQLASQFENKDAVYSKFLAIGLFRWAADALLPSTSTGAYTAAALAAAMAHDGDLTASPHSYLGSITGTSLEIASGRPVTCDTQPW